MRILLIRHGDPDYENDTLTEKGRREAALLAEAAPYMNLGTCFVSPLGRAQDTAAYSLKKIGRTAETIDWLEEFSGQIDLNRHPEMEKAYQNVRRLEDGSYAPRGVWDMLPSYWTERPEYFDREKWRESEITCYTNVIEKYDWVTGGLDAFLADHGYVRERNHYRAERASTETVTFFCHFGVTCVILSHLLNMSPFVLWHGLALAPTSVTEVVTEERQRGIASFRGLRVGDISHLYAGHEPASFAARFAEVYDDMEHRH
mgnify:FL=1